MARARQFDLEDIVNRPGTYFNPQTEVLVVIDDSPDVDTEIFNLEDFEGADWVLISDESPIDEHICDELMQAFQVRHGAGAGAPAAARGRGIAYIGRGAPRRTRAAVHATATPTPAGCGPVSPGRARRAPA